MSLYDTIVVELFLPYQRYFNPSRIENSKLKLISYLQRSLRSKRFQSSYCGKGRKRLLYAAVRIINVGR